MNMKKQMIIAVVILFLGIAIINGFLFSMENWENKCECNESIAQSACIADCTDLGGCAGYALSRGSCYNGDCESTLSSLCRDYDPLEGPIVGPLVTFGCWQCVEF